MWVGASHTHQLTPVCGASYPQKHTPAQVTATNVDIARVAPTYHLYTVEEVEGVIGRL